jgi:hypothetical protein
MLIVKKNTIFWSLWIFIHCCSIFACETAPERRRRDRFYTSMPKAADGIWKVYEKALFLEIKPCTEQKNDRENTNKIHGYY